MPHKSMQKKKFTLIRICHKYSRETQQYSEKSMNLGGQQAGLVTIHLEIFYNKPVKVGSEFSNALCGNFHADRQ